MGVVERITGLTARQVRYWEKHGLIAPARTKGRHRMYTEADLIRLKEIKRLVASGMNMEQVKAYLARRKAAPAQGQAPVLPAERIAERLPTLSAGPVRSLYTGANRAELQRLIDRKPSP
nr:MerR family transcriptional regulator [Symbiobacterium terraclitae]